MKKMLSLGIALLGACGDNGTGVSRREAAADIAGLWCVAEEACRPESFAVLYPTGQADCQSQVERLLCAAPGLCVGGVGPADRLDECLLWTGAFCQTQSLPAACDDVLGRYVH